MLEIIPAVLGAGAIFFFVFAIATPAWRGRVDARLGRLSREEPLTEREAELSQSFVERVGLPSVNVVRDLIRRMLPSTIATVLEDRLRKAGEPTSLHSFVLIQFAAVGVALLFMVGAFSMGFSGMFLFVFLAISGVSIAMPFLWLDSTAGSRRKAFQKELPDAADLIVTMVEAGMSIDASLVKVAEQLPGPLGDELRLTMRETTLGRARKDALLGLVERTNVPEIRTFVQSIIHAQATGVPLGQVLRTQASEIRLKKRQRAEEAAQKAPVKVLLVMIFFIMPALFLMLLGPAIMNASQFL